MRCRSCGNKNILGKIRSHIKKIIMDANYLRHMLCGHNTLETFNWMVFWSILLICTIKNLKNTMPQMGEAEFKTIKVFLDIEARKDGEVKPLGKIIIELSDKTPKTSKNFLEICKGKTVNVNGKEERLSYEGCALHRIIPGFVIQGGDFETGTGTGGRSIYGRKFDDENFVLRHEFGALSMANAGPDTNGSQFFIVLNEENTEHLNERHVVFGKVVSEDKKEILKKIESYGTPRGVIKDSYKVVIARCGVHE